MHDAVGHPDALPEVVERQEAEHAVRAGTEAVEGGARGLLRQLFAVEGEVAAPEGPPVVPVVVAQCPDRSHLGSLAPSVAGGRDPPARREIPPLCRSRVYGGGPPRRRRCTCAPQLLYGTVAIGLLRPTSRYGFVVAGDVDERGVSSVMPVESPSTGPGRSSSDDPDRSRWLPTLTDQLNRPLSTPFCVLGWLASIGLFVALVTLFGGPSLIDSQESTYSTWAIAHGEFSCAYPSVTRVGEPLVAPLYPLLAGSISAVTRIGHDLPFPSSSALGPGCRKGLVAMNHWFSHSGALRPTTWVGCATWLALMVGVIAWLRASGRGRRGWEPVTLFVVAALLPVWMCVQTYFHPQDLLALGLALSALACARRDRWLMAGILLALAILSQQFALLVAVPLFIVAPAAKKTRFAGAALLAGAVVVLPLVVLTSGRVLRPWRSGAEALPPQAGPCSGRHTSPALPASCSTACRRS